MAFTPTKETYSGKVYSVTIGTGDKAVTFGGENVLPFNAVLLILLALLMLIVLIFIRKRR